MRLINYVRQIEVDLERDDGHAYSFKVTAPKSLHLKKAWQGIGVLYFSTSLELYGESASEKWSSALVISDPRPVEITHSPSGRSELRVVLSRDIPAVGVKTMWQGFLVAPALKLSLGGLRNDISLMLISGRSEVPQVSLESARLAFEQGKTRADIVIRAGHEMHCRGPVSEVRFAQLVLTRRPIHYTGNMRATERLAESTGAGIMTATWKPVVRTFPELVLICRPSTLLEADFDRIALHMEGDTESYPKSILRPFIFGDGRTCRYSLSLIVKKAALRRSHRIDTKVEVT